MANNRLYLRCKKCKATLFLDKTFGEPYRIGTDKLLEINTFFDEHADCEPQSRPFPDGGLFELIDERSIEGR